MSGLEGVNGMKGDSKVPKGNYKVVIYDFETTGKSLIDEICHIGCYAPNTSEQKKENGAEEKVDEKDNEMYSQYIMPHRNLSFSARNAYGLVVVSLDYQRMLRDTNTGKLLKTKSEISALKDWMKWLEEVKGDSDGIILVHHAHDQSRDLHVPLLLVSLGRYNLVSQFSNIVKGFCNSVNVISDLGDKSLITSLSLRSLCKTVLKDTSLSTYTAKNRCTRINEILSSVSAGNQSLVDKVVPFAMSVDQGQADLRSLETIQKAQYSMRPIFAEYFSSGYKLRSQMVGIRRCLAENGLDYNKLMDLDKQDKLAGELEKLDLQDPEQKTVMIQTVTSHFKDKAAAGQEGEGGDASNQAEDNKDSNKSQQS